MLLALTSAGLTMTMLLVFFALVIVITIAALRYVEEK